MVELQKATPAEHTEHKPKTFKSYLRGATVAATLAVGALGTNNQTSNAQVFSSRPTLYSSQITKAGDTLTIGGKKFTIFKGEAGNGSKNAPFMVQSLYPNGMPGEAYTKGTLFSPPAPVLPVSYTPFVKKGYYAFALTVQMGNGTLQKGVVESMKPLGIEAYDRDIKILYNETIHGPPVYMGTEVISKHGMDFISRGGSLSPNDGSKKYPFVVMDENGLGLQRKMEQNSNSHMPISVLGYRGPNYYAFYVPNHALFETYHKVKDEKEFEKYYAAFFGHGFNGKPMPALPNTVPYIEKREIGGILFSNGCRIFYGAKGSFSNPYTSKYKNPGYYLVNGPAMPANLGQLTMHPPSHFMQWHPIAPEFRQAPSVHAFKLETPKLNSKKEYERCVKIASHLQPNFNFFAPQQILSDSN